MMAATPSTEEASVSDDSKHGFPEKVRVFVSEADDLEAHLDGLGSGKSVSSAPSAISRGSSRSQSFTDLSHVTTSKIKVTSKSGHREITPSFYKARAESLESELEIVLDKLSAEHHRNRKLIDELEQAEARFTETTWEIDGVEYSNETLGEAVENVLEQRNAAIDSSNMLSELVEELKAENVKQMRHVETLEEKLNHREHVHQQQLSDLRASQDNRIRDLQADLAALDDEKTALRKRSRTLEDERERLDSDLQRKNSEVDKLSAATQQLSSELQTALATLRNEEQTSQDLRKQLDDALQDVHAQQQATRQEQSNAKRLEGDVRALTSQLERERLRFEGELMSLADQLQRSTDRASKLEEMLHDERDQFSASNVELQQLRRHSADLTASTKQLASENSSLKNQLAAFEEETPELRSNLLQATQSLQLAESKHEQLIQSNAHLREQLEALKADDRAQLEDASARSQRQFDMLNQEHEAALASLRERHELRIKQMNTEHEEARAQLGELQRKSLTYAEEHQRFLERITVLESTLKQRDVSVSELRADTERLQSQLTTAQKQAESATRDLASRADGQTAKHQAELQMFKDKLAQVRQQLKDAEQARADLEQQEQRALQTRAFSLETKTQEVEDIKTRLVTREEEIAVLRRQLKSVQDEAVQHKERAKAHASGREELEEELHTAQRRAETLALDNEQLNASVAKLRTDAATTRREYETQIEQLTSKLSLHQHSTEETDVLLKQQIQTFKSVVADLETQRDAHLKTIEQLQARDLETRSASNSYSAQLQIAQEEKTQLQRELQQLQSQLVKTKADADAREDELKDASSSLKEALEGAREQLLTHKMAADASNKRVSELEDALTRLAASHKRELEAHRDMASETERSIQLSSEQSRSVVRQSLELEYSEQLASLTRTNDNMRLAHERLQAKIVQHEDALRVAEETENAVRQQLSASLSKQDALAAEYAQLQERDNRTQQQLAAARKQLAEAEAAAEDAASTMRKVESQLTEQLSDRQTRIRSLEHSVETLEASLEAARSEVSALQTREEELSGLEQRYAACRTQRDEASRSASEKESEVSNTRARVEKLEQQLAMAGKERLDALSELKQLRESTDAAKQSAAAKLKRAESKAEALEEEKEKLRLAHMAKQSELMSDKVQLESTVDTLERKVTTLELSLTSIRETLSVKEGVADEERTRLLATVAELQQELAAAEQRHALASSSLSTLKTRAAELKSKLDDALTDAAAAKERASRLATQLAEAQQDKNASSRDIASSAQQLKALAADLDNAQLEARKADAEAKRLAAINEQLERDLARVQQELASERQKLVLLQSAASEQLAEADRKLHAQARKVEAIASELQDAEREVRELRKQLAAATQLADDLKTKDEMLAETRMVAKEAEEARAKAAAAQAAAESERAGLASRLASAQSELESMRSELAAFKQSLASAQSSHGCAMRALTKQHQDEQQDMTAQAERLAHSKHELELALAEQRQQAAGAMAAQQRAEQRVEALEGQEQALALKLAALEQELAQQKEAASRTYTSLTSQMESEQRKADGERSAHRREMTEVSNKVDLLEEELEGRQAELERLAQRVKESDREAEQRILAETATLQRRIAALESQAEAADTRAQAAVDASLELKRELSVVETMRRQLASQAEVLQDERSALSLRVSELEVFAAQSARLKELNEQLNLQLEQLEAAAASNKTERARLEAENNALRASLEHREQLVEAQLARERSVATDLEERLVSLRRDVLLRVDHAEQQKAAVDDCNTRTFSQLEDSNKRLVAQVDALEASIAALKQNNASLSFQLDSVKSERDMQAQKAQRAQEALEASELRMSRSIEELEARVKELTLQTEADATMLQRKESQLAGLLQDKSELEQRVAQLKQGQIEEERVHTDAKSKLTEELDALQAALQAARQELRSFQKSAAAEARVAEERHRTESDEARRQLQLLKSKMSAVTSELEAMTTSKAQLETQKEQAEHELRQSHARVQELTAELEALQMSSNELAIRLRKVEQEKEALLADVRQRQTQLSQAQQQYERKLQDKQQLIDSLEAAQQASHQENIALSRRTDQYVSQLSVYEKQIDTLRAQLELAEKEGKAAYEALTQIEALLQSAAAAHEQEMRRYVSLVRKRDAELFEARRVQDDEQLAETTARFNDALRQKEEVIMQLRQTVDAKGVASHPSPVVIERTSSDREALLESQVQNLELQLASIKGARHENEGKTTVHATTSKDISVLSLSSTSDVESGAIVLREQLADAKLQNEMLSKRLVQEVAYWKAMCEQLQLQVDASRVQLHDAGDKEHAALVTLRTEASRILEDKEALFKRTLALSAEAEDYKTQLENLQKTSREQGKENMRLGHQLADAKTRVQILETQAEHFAADKQQELARADALRARVRELEELLAQLRDVKEANLELTEELNSMRQTFLDKERAYIDEIDLLKRRISALEADAGNFAKLQADLEYTNEQYAASKEEYLDLAREQEVLQQNLSKAQLETLKSLEAQQALEEELLHAAATLSRSPTPSPSPQPKEAVKPVNKPKRIPTDARGNVQYHVRALLKKLSMPSDYMKAQGDGRYVVHNEDRAINVMFRGSNLMVRIGGGWQSLEEYLQDRHHHHHTFGDAAVTFSKQHHAKIEEGKKQEAAILAQSESS